MGAVRLLLLASLCAAVPSNPKMDKTEIANEDMDEDIVADNTREVDLEVHYHEINTTDLNAKRNGKFQFSFGDFVISNSPFAVIFGNVQVTNSQASYLCLGKICGEECSSSSGTLQVVRYCQPDGSCGTNARPTCPQIKSEIETENYNKGFLIKYPTGKIEMTEFIKMAKEYFEKMTHQTSDAESFCKNVFKACDTDHKGSMSFREAALAIYVGKMDAPKLEKIKYSFRLYDLDKNGVIDKQELYDCMMGLMKALGEKNMEGDMEEGTIEMMAEIDTDNDGKITEEEFTAFNKDRGVDLCRISDMIGQIIQGDLNLIAIAQEFSDIFYSQ